MRVLCGSVLGAEALVVLFAVLVAKDLSNVGGGTVWAVGGTLSLACLVVAGLLRYRWAYAAGSLLQVALLGSAVVVPAMAILGVVFAALWVTAIVVGRRGERARARLVAERDGSAR